MYRDRDLYTPFCIIFSGIHLYTNIGQPWHCLYYLYIWLLPKLHLFCVSKSWWKTTQGIGDPLPLQKNAPQVWSQAPEMIDIISITVSNLLKKWKGKKNCNKLDSYLNWFTLCLQLSIHWNKQRPDFILKTIWTCPPNKNNLIFENSWEMEKRRNIIHPQKTNKAKRKCDIWWWFTQERVRRRIPGLV
jgi:hypothetical protein